MFLVYPTIHTLVLSFMDAGGSRWVGLEDYRFAFQDSDTLIAFGNTIVWLVCFTAVVVALDLLVAVLADRVGYEPVVKTIVFLPMALSFVAAAVI